MGDPGTPGSVTLSLQPRLQFTCVLLGCPELLPFARSTKFQASQKLRSWCTHQESLVAHITYFLSTNNFSHLISKQLMGWRAQRQCHGPLRCLGNTLDLSFVKDDSLTAPVQHVGMFTASSELEPLLIYINQNHMNPRLEKCSIFQIYLQLFVRVSFIIVVCLLF